ncbi:MAG: sulfatase-like hydrolase/transferase [Akkermansiaceae bacterium]
MSLHAQLSPEVELQLRSQKNKHNDYSDYHPMKVPPNFSLKKQIIGSSVIVYIFLLLRVIGSPNIIHLMVDDLGYADLAIMGHPYVKTPHIDKLFREGAQINSYYSCAPVCSPSRGAVVTGKNPVPVWNYFSTRQNNERWGQPDQVTYSEATIARSLASAGYITAHIGKWHLGNVPPSAYGFHVERTAGQYWTYENDFWINSTSQISSEVHAFIDRIEDQPFYLQYWFEAVHAPVIPSEAALAPYNDMVIDFTQFPQRMQDYYAAQGASAELNLKRHMAKITEIDNAVGSLMIKLEQTGQLSNTCILFTSDNGPEWYGLAGQAITGSGSVGVLRGRKRSLYEGGIRMPCCLWMPLRVSPQIHQGAALSQKDFFCTAMDLAGATVPDGVEGESLLSQLGQAERSDDLIWRFEGPIWGPAEYASPPFAIRRGPWKYLTNRDNSIEELYHIPNDPAESNNLAGVEPAKVEELRIALNAWIQANVPNIPRFFIEKQTQESGAVTLDARAKGANLLWHTWFHNDNPVGSGLPSRLQVTETGTYHCVVTNSYGSARSKDFIVTEIPPVEEWSLPQILMKDDGSCVISTSESLWTRPLSFRGLTHNFELQKSSSLSNWNPIELNDFLMIDNQIVLPRNEAVNRMFYRIVEK